jgi:hypothetical protein
VEYIPSDRAVVPLKKGEAAPAEGWFVPPAVMQEIIPYLDEQFRDGKSKTNNPSQDDKTASN